MDEIQTADLMRVLVPLWRRQRPTGQRLRQRIGGVMAWSVAAGYRADDPTSTLSAVLPAGRKQRKHHRFLPAEELREALVKVQGSGAWIGTRLALRFLALTPVGPPASHTPRRILAQHRHHIRFLVTR